MRQLLITVLLLAVATPVLAITKREVPLDEECARIIRPTITMYGKYSSYQVPTVLCEDKSGNLALFVHDETFGSDASHVYRFTRHGKPVKATELEVKKVVID